VSRHMEGPPPLFRQGASIRLQLLFFLLLSVVGALVDKRLSALSGVRGVISAVITPFQKGVSEVVFFVSDSFGYVSTLSSLKQENDRLKRYSLSLTDAQTKSLLLEQENQNLRAILSLKSSEPVVSWAAEIVYESRDPFVRRVLINKGEAEGIRIGLPVVDSQGIVGQVVRVFHDSSEVLLINDRSFAIAVINVRTGMRAVLYGGAEGGLLNLRYVAVTADIKEGDELITSGIDGVYKAGVPVARVVRIDKQSEQNFAHILCAPMAGAQYGRHVLVMDAVQSVVDPSNLQTFIEKSEDSIQKNKPVLSNVVTQ
jgi:rod shape-determining protein MreC